jgi:hypothetical protein
MKEVIAVQQELAELRAARIHQRQLSEIVKQGRRVLRESKRRLGEALAAEGFYYHGDTIRKKRNHHVCYLTTEGNHVG